LLFFGLFLMEFGAGIFLAASLLHNLWGQVAGWLVSGALGGGCHFLFLGHPFRIYKALRRPGKSWISRGLIIISLFQFFGFLHLVLSFFIRPYMGIVVTANVMAVATILYSGYEIADIKSIRTWNSSFFPIQMLARSFFIGLAIVLAVNLVFGLGDPNIDYRKWLLVTLLINISLFIIGLVSVGFEEGKERLSLSMMAVGALKWLFWPWIIAGGMVIPLIVALYGLVGDTREMGLIVLLVAVFLQVFADSLSRYSLIRSGYYQGIFPVNPIDYG
jgi:formate-dependent nitrite reductase membrane component NrfD